MEDYSNYTLTLYDEAGKPHQVPVSALGLNVTPAQPLPEQPEPAPESEQPAPKPTPEPTKPDVQAPELVLTRIGHKSFLRSSAMPVLTRLSRDGSRKIGSLPSILDRADVMRKSLTGLAVFDDLPLGETPFSVEIGGKTFYTVVNIAIGTQQENELPLFNTLAEALESAKPRVAGIGDIFVTKPS